VAVLNLAKGGYTTYHLMPGNFRAPEGRPIPDNFRNISRALRGNPLAVLINLPSNDRASGFSVEEQISNYRAMVALLDERGIPYRITTPGPRDLDEAGLRDQRRLKDELEAAFPGKILDFWTDIVQPDGRINPRYDSGDRLHVNDAAHGVYARRVIANSLLSELGLN
jgi:lysophospholipase L1-like esterase